MHDAQPIKWLAVGAGGCLGAMARHAVNLAVGSLWRFELPLATFIINVSGSAILGWVATHALVRPFDPILRLFVATGFLGAFTTFSTLEYETGQLAARGLTLWAVANLVGSVGAGFLAMWLGVHLAR